MKSKTALKRFLKSIQDKDMKKAFHHTQFHTRSVELRNRYQYWFDNNFIENFEIHEEIYNLHEIVSDVTCSINKIKFKIRLIRETKPFSADPTGQWKVCPASIRKL